MRKLSAMTLAAMFYATTALAAPITGELSLNGSDWVYNRRRRNDL